MKIPKAVLPIWLALLCLPGLVRAGAPGVHVDAPVTKGNLSVYLLRGEGVVGKDYQSLSAGLETGKVRIEEYGGGAGENARVNTLRVRNDTDKPLFLQAGDVVRGGRQDRTLMGSLVVPPKSGWVDLPAFCVESGRWTGESDGTKHFRAGASTLPSRELKMAAQVSRDQSEVWAKVADYNKSAANNVGLAEGSLSPKSPSSLAKSFDNETLAKERAGYYDELHKAVEGKTDVLGAAFAVNGKIVSADLYGSPELFRAKWDSILRSASAEALSHRNESAAAEKPAPSAPMVEAFLSDAGGGKGETRAVGLGTKQVMHKGKKSVELEYEEDGKSVHKSYLADD